MQIKSSAFHENGPIPAEFTCDGEDTAPPMMISGVPGGTKSLVLIFEDPDAPMGTWIHWIVWNIPPETGMLMPGKLPEGAVEGMTSFGRTGYGGPCPPNGEHRYFFRLYALDRILELSPSIDKKILFESMEGHTLAIAELSATYKRS